MSKLMLSYYDQFPEFNGQKIHIRNDGYVSVKDINKAIGKRFNNWTRTKFAQEVIVELAENNNLPIYTSQSRCNETVLGDYSKVSSQLQPIEAMKTKGLIDVEAGNKEGIFVHPTVAFAYSMSDPKFFAKVTMWIFQLNEIGTVNPHILSWTQEEYQRGVDFNRDDINEMYRR